MKEHATSDLHAAFATYEQAEAEQLRLMELLDVLSDELISEDKERSPMEIYGELADVCKRLPNISAHINMLMHEALQNPPPKSDTSKNSSDDLAKE